MKRVFLCIAAALIFVSAARADEFHLKDGTKIVGTIVGYGKNSFRVKTAYGYAEIERSAIVSITVSSPEPEAKEKAPAKESNAKTAESKKAAGQENVAPVATKPNPSTAPAANSAVAMNVAAAKPQANSATPSQVASPPATPPATGSTTGATANTATPTAPEPTPVREEVSGNLYINYTYGFQMYKPPDWDVIAGARAALPGSIVAMGTGDQTTYLIMGLVPASATLREQIAATNDRLAGSFEGYDPEVIRQTTIAGLPAHEYDFHGAANGKEWTGTVALIQRGGNIFTILGVTSTNTDLVQIQQSVIARTIASLQFTSP
jgi:hypothetical protein